MFVDAAANNNMFLDKAFFRSLYVNYVVLSIHSDLHPGQPN